jgi:hypothetical protein
MCLACEEAQTYYRFTLLKEIADGRMPEGVTEEELRAMDLPLPGEIEVVVEPDGTRTLVLKKRQETSGQNPFACDSPNS